MIIGGAGSIGFSFITELIKFEPKKIIVADNNENGLAELTRSLRNGNHHLHNIKLITYPVDYGSVVFKHIYTYHQPYFLVANFAAHKHVRSEKDKFSIQALLENNIVKLADLMETMKTNPPERFFSVSSDKATNPVNIMGATKKWMETIIFSYSTFFKVTSARLANVAFSNGSLLDAFLFRLQKGQPLSCPSDVKRYFVSCEEAGQFCLIASVLGKNGEVYFPLFNKSHLKSFLSIAQKLLSFINFRPIMCESENEAINFTKEKSFLNKEYPLFSFNSNTTGEKLEEEFYSTDENVNTVEYKSIGSVKNKSHDNANNIKNFIDELREAINNVNIDKNNLVELIKKSVPSFDHIDTGISLDDKM